MGGEKGNTSSPLGSDGYPHWPCVVVSPDHLLGEEDVEVTKITPNQRISAYFLFSAEHNFYTPRKAVGFVEGLQKNFQKMKTKKSKAMAKVWPDSLVQMRAYAKIRHECLFSILNMIFFIVLLRFLFRKEIFQMYYSSASTRLRWSKRSASESGGNNTGSKGS